MANLQGIEVKKGKIGANTLAGGTGISGLVISAPAPSGLQHLKTTELRNLVDAENLGITPNFDKDNNVNAYRHIREFFRMGGEGQKLFVMFVAQTVTMMQICEDARYAKQLLINANGDIRQLAIAVNPTGLITKLNGLPADVYYGIAKAQALALWAFNRDMPCQVLLEGHNYTGPAASAADLRALLNVQATKVSVVIGQDYSHAKDLTGNAQKLADVGTALGTLSAAAVNQNIGDNEAFDLTDTPRKAWLSPGLSSHEKNADVYADLQTLEDKGYIFGTTYTGLAGVRWNNDHTCCKIVRDAEGNVNEHTISYGRTLDEAGRNIRRALLPKVKTSHPVDAKTGKLPVGVIKNFEGIGDTALGDMVARREISEGQTIVDKDSDLVVKKELKTKFNVVPYGQIGSIEGTINLKTNL